MEEHDGRNLPTSAKELVESINTRFAAHVSTLHFVSFGYPEDKRYDKKDIQIPVQLYEDLFVTRTFAVGL